MRLVSIALFALLVPTTAHAQNRGIFIDAGALAGIRFTPTTDGDPVIFATGGSPTYQWNDINGDRLWQPGEEVAPRLPSTMLDQGSTDRFAPGGSAAIGVRVSPAISLRIEGMFQADYVTDVEPSNPMATEVRHTAEISDFAVAAGWHHGSRRATIAYVGGVVFRRQRNETILTSRYGARIGTTGLTFGLLGTPYVQQLSATSYTTGVTAGIDVSVRMTRHLSAVPQLRMVAFNQDWQIRPILAIRWHQ
jgi:hypothetical protein